MYQGEYLQQIWKAGGHQYATLSGLHRATQISELTSKSDDMV